MSESPAEQESATPTEAGRDTLPGQLLLLATGALGRRGLARWRIELGLGLAAATLLELAWAGRITLGPGRVEVQDPRGVPDPAADAVLRRIVLDRRGWTAADWVAKTARAQAVRPVASPALPEAHGRTAMALPALVGAMRMSEALGTAEAGRADPPTVAATAALAAAVRDAVARHCF